MSMKSKERCKWKKRLLGWKDKARELLDLLEKNESLGQLIKTKRPERAQKTTKVSDDRIISMVKKTPITTSNQAENTFEMVRTSLSRSKIKRCLHECKYRGFTTRRKPLVTLWSTRTRLVLAKKTPSNRADKNSLDRWTFYQNDGMMGREPKTAPDLDPYNNICQTWQKWCYGCLWNQGTNVYWWSDCW